MTCFTTLLRAGSAVATGAAAAILYLAPMPALAQMADPLTCETALGGAAPVELNGDEQIGRCCLVAAEADWYEERSITEGVIYQVAGGPAFQAMTCSASETTLAQINSLSEPGTDAIETGSIKPPPPEI